MPNAKVEFRIQNNEPTVSIRVPRGTTLRDIARIQASLFEDPGKLGNKFEDLVRGCPNCTSGVHLDLREEAVLPVTREIQEMFTHLTNEMRTISSRLANLESGKVKPASAEIITNNVNVSEIEF